MTAIPAASSAAVWPSPHTAPISDERQKAAALAHQRRHGAEVVDVERVAQPEHEAETEDGERARRHEKDTPICRRPRPRSRRRRAR